jgi:hypothetical protein
MSHGNYELWPHVATMEGNTTINDWTGVPVFAKFNDAITWTVISRSSGGETITKPTCFDNCAPTTIWVCDVEADGHHAYGQVWTGFHGTWQEVTSGDALDGTNNCTIIGSLYWDDAVNTASWTYEGATRISGPNWSAVVPMN